jgi:1-deoxy-D-xylulose-5-phosphate synthase
MIDLAKHDQRVVALTAAMPDGTGLSKFEAIFPDRYVDTGICEGHLTAMAAGMSKGGLRPFVAIYSTFMQRAFDQVWQEVALQGLPVTFCMDRAGFVGDDGAVHHGFCDQAFMRPMPGMVLMAPSDEADLNACLRLCLTLDGPAALRYPRDVVPVQNFADSIEPDLRPQAAAPWQLGRSRVLRKGADATLVVYGALAQTAMLAAEALLSEGIDLEVVDARFCKPLDEAMLMRVLNSPKPVITLEDHSLQNGFATAVLEFAAAHQLPIQGITRLGMPDRLIFHASRPQQLAEVGLDVTGITSSVREAIRKAGAKDPATAPHRPEVRLGEAALRSPVRPPISV